MGENTASTARTAYISTRSDSTVAVYWRRARPRRIFVHRPREGACKVRGFRRCPCCGCDVLADLDGVEAQRGGCCNLCHPHNDCAECLDK